LQFLPKYSSALDLSQNRIQIVKKILDAANKRNITDGKDPKGMCGAAIYLSGKILNPQTARIIPTQAEIASEAGVTEATVRARYKELVKKLNINLSR